MAEFIVTFDRGIEPGPEYEDYIKTVSTICGEDGYDRTLTFNDTVNGDFVIGYNYTSLPGYSADTLIISSYSDEMTWEDVDTNVSIPTPGFTPSELQDTTTSTVLTYPHSMSISDLANISLTPSGVELICGGSKYIATRKREISYHIVDTNGQSGIAHKATFINNEV